jgi:hypothetical protein
MLLTSLFRIELDRFLLNSLVLCLLLLFFILFFCLVPTVFLRSLTLGLLFGVLLLLVDFTHVLGKVFHELSACAVGAIEDVLVTASATL